MKLKFFTDRDLAETFPQTLKNSRKIKVISYREQYSSNIVSDSEWLEFAGKKNLIVITHDEHIRYRPNERRALEHYKVGMVLLVGKRNHDLLAECFIATFAKIKKWVISHKKPYILKVYCSQKSGNRKKACRIEQFFPSLDK